MSLNPSDWFSGGGSGGISGVAQAATGGILGFAGSLYQDYRNRKAVDRSQDWSAGMSNTSYQRAVRDLRAAGLNPMLAYGQGGASTPQGQMIGTDAPDVQGGISSAIQMKRLSAELENLAADTDAKSANAEAARAQKTLTNNTAKKVAVETDYSRAVSEMAKTFLPWLGEAKEQSHSAKQSLDQDKLGKQLNDAKLNPHKGR